MLSIKLYLRELVIDTKFLSSLFDIIKFFPEYWEQGELQKYKVIEDLKSIELI